MSITQLSHETIKLVYVGQEREVYGLMTARRRLIKGILDDQARFCTEIGVFLHINKTEWVRLKSFIRIYAIMKYEGFAIRKIVEINGFREFCRSLKNRNIRRK